MADVLHRRNKIFFSSVNTPDFDPTEWLINPDFSNIQGLPPKYWLIQGDSITPLPEEQRELADFMEGMEDASVNHIRDIVRQKINTARDTIIDHGIVFKGYLFDCDDRARQNINGMCSAIALGAPIPQNFAWRSKTNHLVPMTTQELVQFGLGAASYISNVYEASWQHKDRILLLGDKDLLELFRYDVNAMWPTNSIDGGPQTHMESVG